MVNSLCKLYIFCLIIMSYSPVMQYFETNSPLVWRKKFERNVFNGKAVMCFTLLLSVVELLHRDYVAASDVKGLTYAVLSLGSQSIVFILKERGKSKHFMDFFVSKD